MFETSEILDLIVLLLSISTIILYSISVIAEERVKVPVVTEDKYQHYIDEANFALATMFLSITTIIIMTMRFLWILTTHLPIFGCIFYTITYAFKDLMHICTTIFVIVLGIAFSINLIYGSGDSLFEDLWTVQLQLIYILINPNAFGKYQDGMFGDNYTPLFMGLFLYFFMIVLYFTLILTLTSILIVRYRFLRATIQQRSEAVALIIHKQTKEYISKWVHLMLCRRPRDTQQVNTNDDESGLTLWVKMRINFNDILFGFKLKNKKEKEEEVQDAMKKIKALKKVKGSLEFRRKMYSPENYNKHKKDFKQMCLFALWYIITFTVVVLQLKTSKNYEQTSVRQYLKTIEFELDTTDIFGISPEDSSGIETGYDNVAETRLIQQWVSETLVPTVYGESYRILKHNYVLSSPYLRVSVIKRDYNNTFGEELDRKTFMYNGRTLNYNEPGTSLTPNQEGGFVLDYPDDQMEATEAKYINDVDAGPEADLFVTKNWYKIIHEFITFNSNSGYFVLHEITFEQTKAGLVQRNYKIYTWRSLYSNSLDIFRAFLELIYFFLFLYFALRMIVLMVRLYILNVKQYFNDKASEEHRLT